MSRESSSFTKSVTIEPSMMMGLSCNSNYFEDWSIRICVLTSLNWSKLVNSKVAWIVMWKWSQIQYKHLLYKYHIPFFSTFTSSLPKLHSKTNWPCTVLEYYILTISAVMTQKLQNTLSKIKAEHLKSCVLIFVFFIFF